MYLKLLNILEIMRTWFREIRKGCRGTMGGGPFLWNMSTSLNKALGVSLLVRGEGVRALWWARWGPGYRAYS